ncbi:hydantoinase B/oxoprolinase family protein [Pseudonocardia benzenivorans]|uniref:Hydantoinase B/oxoprolinase family protein n=1 Tax=Pseudonocardia benzenivorans TaxID=228005 RepID=A0ABW3VMP6_9PSEU
MTIEEQAPAVSPIVLEVVEGALESVRHEMEVLVDRTARSSIIREQHDQRAGIYDASGRCVTAVSFSSVPTPIIRKFAGTIRPGDIFIHNDVYQSDGGVTHLPDLCLTAPVFRDGELVAFVQSFGHTGDIGGMLPGSIPLGSTEVFQEGILIPPSRLYHGGDVDTDLYDLILRNSRFPDELRGDIDAFCAAVRAGAERVATLFARYGTPTVISCFDRMLERCASDLREVVLPQIPDGTYRFEDFCEYEDVQPAEPRTLLRIRCTMTKTADGILFDFDGTDGQVSGSLNWPGTPSSYARYLGALLKGYAPDVVINDGVLDVVRVDVPKGSLLSPEFPAACAWRTYPFMRLLDIGQGLLAQATDGQVPAAAEPISAYGIFGARSDGTPFLLREITGAGSGARSYADGADTVDAAPESRNMPAEFAENFFPVRVEHLGLRPDSGGPGKFRGGHGYWKDIRVLTDGLLFLYADRVRLAPWGVAGGRAGASARWILNPGTPEERQLPAKAEGLPIKAGAVLRVLTSGGGGWGDPLDRDPATVLLDVHSGVVSAEAANAAYGVVLTTEDGRIEIDGAATEALRAARRSTGPGRSMFDRGPGFRELVASGALVPWFVEDDAYVGGQR